MGGGHSCRRLWEADTWVLQRLGGSHWWKDFMNWRISLFGGFHGRKVLFEVKLRSHPSSGAILAFLRHNAWEALID